MNSNEIVVQGAATIKVKPDMATIEIKVSKSDSVESKALSDLNNEMQNITATLEKIGFTKIHIRVGDYSISENYDRAGKYTAQNSLTINFKLNNLLVDNFYRQLELAKPNNVSVYFRTYLSDELKKVSESQLVKQVIENAKINAVEIANALEVKLGSLKYVSKSGYRGRDDNKFGIKPLEIVQAGAPSVNIKTTFANFDVEEKELSDQITLVFYIDKN